MSRIEPADFLRAMFDAAIAAADPALKVKQFLPPPPTGRIFIAGAGKCTAAMARAVEAEWADVKNLSGMIIVPQGHNLPLQRIDVVEGGHPVPNEAGMLAAEQILREVATLGPGDMLLFLVSGGGSALMTLPPKGLTLADLQEVNRQLLACGAAVHEMNAVRKHLCRVKGGRLAAAVGAGAQVVTLAISDVAGDDPAVIASGPTVPDPTTYADALAVLAHYRVDPPLAVKAQLHAADDETPKWGDQRLRGAVYRMMATPKASLDAAADIARAHGVTPILLGDEIEGEAREVARAFAGIAKAVSRHSQPSPPPAVLLSGGETTVTVRGKGRGGRNTEFLLALMIALGGMPGINAIAGDTDGVDGVEDSAGAILSPGSLARLKQAGIDPLAALANNDSYTAFAALGDLVKTGPTLTNVNDFRAIYVS